MNYSIITATGDVDNLQAVIDELVTKVRQIDQAGGEIRGGVSEVIHSGGTQVTIFQAVMQVDQ